MRKTVAIDMDGVLANVEQQFIDWYERDYGVKIDRRELHGLAEEDALPIKGLAKKFVFTPGFFRTLPLMDGAVDAVKTIMGDFDVYIVSAAMEFPQSLSEKLEWLSIHFPFISWRNIIFCGSKAVINTDYMVDDHVKNLDNFKGKTIMFHAFHNVNHHHHTRAHNWEEVVGLLRQA